MLVYQGTAAPVYQGTATTGYLPASHSVQTVEAATAAYLPTPQLAQVEATVSPIAAENLPATQSVQTVEPVVARYWPAAQACAVSKELGLDPAKVNPNGSGISLGHPIGATGALITVKALHELQRVQGKYALVTMCIGGGQGIAAIFERM